MGCAALKEVYDNMKWNNYDRFPYCIIHLAFVWVRGMFAYMLFTTNES